MAAENGPIAPFDDGPGVWLRAALHVHTTETDGWLTPVMQRRYHAWAGYDALAITDHDLRTAEPPGEDHLVMIGGTEISLTAPRSGGPLHLLGIGIAEQPKLTRDASLTEAALAVREMGGLPFLAHPVWSGLRTDEVDGIEHVAGVEIYNGSCEVEQDRADATVHWDLWLSMGHRLGGIATDDTHYPGFDAFRGWTMVHARDRSPEALQTALAAGRYYASSGPRIVGMDWDDGVLTVRTTPVQSISAQANPPFGARVTAGQHALAYYGQRLPTADGQTMEGLSDGELLTGATFRHYPGVRYVRISIVDALGRRAWSNPLWAE